MSGNTPSVPGANTFLYLLHTDNQTDTYVCLPTNMHTYIYVYTYVVGVNINTAGMSIFLLPMEFYILVGKYLHYSTFDDVITLPH